MILSKTKLIWLLVFFILLEVVWLEYRTNKLISLSPETLLAQQQKQTEENLQKIPEPEILENLPDGAKIWLEPKEGSASGTLTLAIWLETSKPTKNIDLKIFYPKDYLKLIGNDWKEENGIASFSKTLIQAVEGKTKVTEISFSILKNGKAKIEFDFTKESILDSNVWNLENKDILEEVTWGEYLLN